MSFNFDFSDDILGATVSTETTGVASSTDHIARPINDEPTDGMFGGHAEEDDDEDGDPFKDCWGVGEEPAPVDPHLTTTVPKQQPLSASTSKGNHDDDRIASKQEGGACGPRGDSADSTRTACMLPPSPRTSTNFKSSSSFNTNVPEKRHELSPRSVAEEGAPAAQTSTRTSATLRVSGNSTACDEADGDSLDNSRRHDGSGPHRGPLAPVVAEPTIVSPSTTEVSDDIYTSLPEKTATLTPSSAPQQQPARGRSTLSSATTVSGSETLPSELRLADTCRPQQHSSSTAQQSGTPDKQLSSNSGNTPSRSLFTTRKGNLLVEAQSAILAAEQLLAKQAATGAAHNTKGDSDLAAPPPPAAAAFLTVVSNLDNSAKRQLERMCQLEAECALTQMRSLDVMKPLGHKQSVPLDNEASSLLPILSEPVSEQDMVRSVIMSIDPTLLDAPVNFTIPVLVSYLRDALDSAREREAHRSANPLRFAHLLLPHRCNPAMPTSACAEEAEAAAVAELSED